MAGKIQIVVGGQFGSEGKGHACAELAKREREMFAIRTGGPNAGHTAYDLLGREHKLRQVPVAAVVNPAARVAVAGRSLVQLDLLAREAKEVGSRVIVDPAATVLEPGHVAVEEADEKLRWGSTQKGIGAARMDRLHRTARTYEDAVQNTIYETNPLLTCADVLQLARAYLREDRTVQIEAAQGYGLGLHTRFYPKTTSADCRAIDALADVGLSPWEFPGVKLDIWMVVRPYPIRVAGDSGPLFAETSWAELGLPEERTTVTNKVRRVGRWDAQLVAEAINANGREVKLWMNMADHVFPFLSGLTEMPEGDARVREVRDWIEAIYHSTGGHVWALGTGPESAIFLEDDE